MYEEFCPECGHLLTKNRTLCQFCGWSVKLFDSNTKNDLDFEFAFLDNFQDNHLTALWADLTWPFKTSMGCDQVAYSLKNEGFFLSLTRLVIK